VEKEVPSKRARHQDFINGKKQQESKAHILRPQFDPRIKEELGAHD